MSSWAGSHGQCWIALSKLLRVFIGECSAVLWFCSMAEGLGSSACTTLHCENPRGSVCSCCSFITGNIDMLQFSRLYHPNTETVSSTIILLTSVIKILAYWMLHCCFCVEWWYTKPPKIFFLFYSGTVLLHLVWVEKKMFTFCVSSDCSSFKWLRKQLQRFWDTFSSWGALMYLTGEECENA